MNRRERRKLEKQGTRDEFDEQSHWKLRYDFSIPPHLLRGKNPSRIAGAIEARDEADLLRGVIVTLMNAAQFSQDQRAVVGTIAEALNPFSKTMRGQLAYALIEGQGIVFSEDEVEVCSKCGAQKQQTIHPDPAPVAEENDEDDVEMLDTTQHTDTCPYLAIPDDGEVPVYTETPMVSILLPRKYPHINEQAAAEVAEEAEAEEGATIPEEAEEVVEVAHDEERINADIESSTRTD